MPQYNILTNLYQYHRHIILGTSITAVAFMIYLMLASEGTHTHDEIGHYLVSRDAWLYPDLIFNIWGRFLHTLAYMIPALGGLTGVRLFSFLMAIITVLITTIIARELNYRYWYLVPFTLFYQPWFTELSFLGITQVPFMVIMVTAAWYFIHDKHKAVSLLVGLLSLVRHEGIALAGILGLFYVYHKRYKALIFIALPYIVYNSLSWIFTGNIPLLIFFEPVPNTVYGSGSWYHFLIRLPHPQAVGIPMCLLAILGLPHIFRSKDLSLITIWYAVYFLLHTTLYSFGLFASGGYKFFLLPMAPLFAIFCVLGVRQIYISLEHRFSKYMVNIIVISIFGVCLVWNLIFVSPHQLSDKDLAVKEAVEWVKKKKLEDRFIASTDVYFYHWLPMKIHPETLWEAFPDLQEMPEGAIVVWGGAFSEHRGLDRAYMESHSDDWKKRAVFGDNLTIIYEKIGASDLNHKNK